MAVQTWAEQRQQESYQSGGGKPVRPQPNTENTGNQGMLGVKKRVFFMEEYPTYY